MPRLVEHHADHHLRQVRPLLLGRAVLPEGLTAVADEHQRGGVEQHQRQVGKQGAPALEQRFLDSISPEAAISYLTGRVRAPGGPESPAIAQLKKELEFEYAIVKAGGLLAARV